MKLLVLAFLLFATQAEALSMCRGQRNTPGKTCLVDGDTIWLKGVIYRLKGFDTPEPTNNICGGAMEVALAKRASTRA